MRWILPKELVIGSTIYICTKKSIVMGSFIYQKIVSMTFFIYNYVRNFFLTRESACFHSMDCSLARCGKLMFNQFFWLKHSSAFTSYILLQISVIKYFMRDFYSILERSVGNPTILNCLETNIFSRLKYFSYKPIPHNSELMFMEKIVKKISDFFKCLCTECKQMDWIFMYIILIE